MSKHFSLFSVVGIEIEYMIVSQKDLNIVPYSDQLLKILNEKYHQNSKIENEITINEIAVSNELVLHVIELKNYKPQPFGSDLWAHFQKAVININSLLHKLKCQLLPTAAHPWMDPHKETKRWPHDNQEIYTQYDRIFSCRGHGWSNLQSMHINLPFANDEEFAKLHSAIRLILPLLPALCASSPILDGKPTGFLDTRLCYYAKNQQQLPSISGNIIPELINSKEEYQKKILKPMYKEIQPFDPAGILQEEWLNSRGAIPKFNYNAIEIRIVDTQECVQSDIAIASAVFNILKHWVSNSDYFFANACPTQELKQIYDESLSSGLATKVSNPELLKQWQVSAKATTLRAVWQELLAKIAIDLDGNSMHNLNHILTNGNLSERILKACNQDYSRENIKQIYQRLGNCLQENQIF